MDGFSFFPGKVLSTSNVTITSGNNQYYLQNNQMFSASADINAASSGTDNPLILFKNPSGSGKVVYFVKIQAGCTVANVSVEFKIFISPTITSNGTTLTNYQRNLGNSPSNGTSTTFTLPTISANGNLVSSVVTGQNSNSALFAEDFSLAVQPNNNILITGNPLSNNRNTSITLIWVEV